MSELCRLSHKDVLYHKEFELLEYRRERRITPYRIVTHDVKCSQLARRDRVDHLDGVHAGLFGLTIPRQVA